MFTNYDRIKETQAIGEVQYPDGQNTVAQIITQYYDIISQRETLASLQEAVEVSKSGSDITRSRLELAYPNKSTAGDD